MKSSGQMRRSFAAQRVWRSFAAKSIALVAVAAVAAGSGLLAQSAHADDAATPAAVGATPDSAPAETSDGVQPAAGSSSDPAAIPGDSADAAQPAADAENSSPVPATSPAPSASSADTAATPSADPTAPTAPADAPVVNRLSAVRAGTPGAVSALALVLESDGTVPFDADDAPGNDSSAHNGVVRTRDSVVYRWNYSVGTAGDVTFTQKLPTGMVWDVVSTASCSQGASAISADKLTLTCTLANSAAGAGSYLVQANVGSAGNGQALTTHVVSGAFTSNDVTVTASGAPAVEVAITSSGNASVGTAPAGAGFDGQQGVRAAVGVQMYTRIDPAKGLRGREALGNSFSFDLDLSSYSPNTVPVACGTTFAAAGTPYGKITSASINATNAVQDSGTWTCTQPGGPGTPVHVTINNAITDALTYPTKSNTGGGLNTALAYLVSGGVQLWTPVTEVPAGGLSVKTRLVNFDPDGISGQSNFGAGYAPGQGPGAVDISGINYTAAFFNLSTSAGLVRHSEMWDANGSTSYTGPAIAGGTTSISGDAPLFPNQKFRVGFNVSNKSLSTDPATNVALCEVWDSSFMQPVPGATPIVSGASTYFTGTPIYEYTTHVFASEAERRSWDCGTAGDGGADWYPTSTAAADAGLVTGFRMLIPAVIPVADTQVSFAMQRTAAPVAVGTAIPVYTQLKADGLALSKSTYTASTNLQGAVGSSGARALAAEGQVRIAQTWDQPTSKPGETRTVTLTPTVANPYDTGAVTVRDVKATIQLPTPCVQFVPGSSSLPVTAITPADLGPDGVACTADDGKGALLEWDFGDVSSASGVAPITFKVNVLAAITMPATITPAAVISSPSDSSLVAARSSGSNLVVNAPAEFAVTKTASTALAQPGDPVSYQIGWANRLPSSAGVAKLVDVLPRNGDPNGTHDLGGLTLGSVTATSDVVIEYTTTAMATVVSSLASDPNGDTGITWTTTKPGSGVTALRFTTPELVTGASGHADVTVTPTGLVATTSFTNAVTSAKAANLSNPASNVAPVTITSASASIAGTVYNDNDYSWTKTAGDVGLAGATVTLSGYSYGPDGVDSGGPGHGDDVAISPITTTTAADGTYTFAGLHSGKFSAAVTAGVPGTMAAAAVPAQPVALNASAAITGNDFGYIVKLPIPVAGADALVVYKDAATTNVPVLTNDTGDASLSITATSSPTQGGTVAIAADGKSVNYTPKAGFTGTETFTYTVTDKARQTATGTVTVRVIAQPVASNDIYTVPVTADTLLDVLLNDSGDAVALDTIVTAPTQGTATIVSGKIQYHPNAGATGTDSFVYQIKDSQGTTKTATVNLTLQSAPSATADAYKIKAGSSAAAFDVLANDSGTALTLDAITLAPGKGTASIVAGKIQYQPNAGATGTDSLTYRAKDNLGQTTTAQVTFTIQAAPVAVGDSATTGVGAAVSVDVRANDTVPGTATVTTSVSTPAHGTAVVQGDGTILYTPNSGYSGSDAFTYTLTDDLGQTSTATVSITVQSGPTPVADAYKLKAGAAQASYDVLANDGTGLTLTSITTAPSHGTASIVAGKIQYQPTAGYPAAGLSATDTLTYQVKDAVGQTGTAQVTFTIQAAPIAVADSITTGTGVAKTIAVRANDTVPATATITTSTTAPGHGTAVVNPDGTVSYTPAAGYNGPDSFNYTLTDDLGQTATATVTITVQGGPVAVPESYKLKTSAPITSFDVLANDSGVDIVLDAITVNPSHGMATISGGQVQYMATAGYSGVDSFTYRIKDSLGQTAAAVVSITIQAVPVAIADSVTTGVEMPKTIAVLANDTIPATASVTVSIGTAPANGTVAVGSDGQLTYTPAAGFSGQDTLTYAVTDDLGQVSAQATVTITVQPRPVATPESLKVRAGSASNVIDVLANDSGTSIALDAVTIVAAHGTATITAGGIDYVPTAGYAGSDSFTYRIKDNLGQTSLAQVSVVVQAAPIAVADSARTGVDAAVTVGVLANDTIPATATVTVTAAVPAHGTATVNPDGTLTYTPSAGYVGADGFDYTLTDDLGQNTTAHVDLEILAAPVANDDAAQGPHDESLTVSVLDNDQGDGLTIDNVGGATFGTATVSGATIVYVPAVGFAGVDSFSYTVVDSLGQVATAMVTVTIYSPVALEDIAFTTGVGVSYTVDPLTFASTVQEASSNQPTYAPTHITGVGSAAHGRVVLNADGTVTYTPNAGYSGPDSYTFDVADTVGQTASAMASITVQPVPVVAPIAISTQVDVPVTIDALAQASGVDLRFGSIGVAGHGTVEVVDGKLVYTPAGGYVGSDSFTVEIVDNLGQSVTATVSVQVLAEAVPPTPEPSVTPPASGSAPASPTTTLPGTGSNAGMLIWIGVALLLIGGAAGALGRNRRRRTN